ncbi:MAG: ankyrin repeat domain-containing protein [Alphaproteobacteria bacterium]
MVGLSNIFKIVGQACTNFVREEKAAIVREKQTKSLLEAIMASDSDKVEALLKAGVDADAPSTMGNTPLTCAISLRATQRTPESLKVLELVLARVTDIDGITKDSSYLLMAAQIGVAEAAAELLRRGCDMTVKGWGGRDALCFATENGHKSVADLIVAAAQQRNEACAANMHAGLDKPIVARKRLRLKTFS